MTDDANIVNLQQVLLEMPADFPTDLLVGQGMTGTVTTPEGKVYVGQVIGINPQLGTSD